MTRHSPEDLRAHAESARAERSAEAAKNYQSIVKRHVAGEKFEHHQLQPVLERAGKTWDDFVADCKAREKRNAMLAEIGEFPELQRRSISLMQDLRRREVEEEQRQKEMSRNMEADRAELEKLRSSCSHLMHLMQVLFSGADCDPEIRGAFNMAAAELHNAQRCLADHRSRLNEANLDVLRRRDELDSFDVRYGSLLSKEEKQRRNELEQHLQSVRSEFRRLEKDIPSLEAKEKQAAEKLEAARLAVINS